jgi:N-ethylmaleimide reductase
VVADTVGADRTGVRLSPNGNSQGANDSDPTALFTAAAGALSEIGIAFLELREPGFNGTFGKAEVAPTAPSIRRAFAGALVLNSDYDAASGQAMLDSGTADAIAFGRTFIANPDLPHRIAANLPLAKDNAATWYSQGPEGYVDYPTAA